MKPAINFLIKLIVALIIMGTVVNICAIISFILWDKKYVLASMDMLDLLEFNKK